MPILTCGRASLLSSFNQSGRRSARHNIPGTWSVRGKRQSSSLAYFRSPDEVTMLAALDFDGVLLAPQAT